jgi:hypothetical protein
MANRAGLRKVVKTVRTKKGVARRGLFNANTLAARRVGGIIGAVGGVTLALAATHYGENGRAEQFREAYNQRVREAHNVAAAHAAYGR